MGRPVGGSGGLKILMGRVGSGGSRISRVGLSRVGFDEVIPSDPTREFLQATREKPYRVRFFSGVPKSANFPQHRLHPPQS